MMKTVLAADRLWLRTLLGTIGVLGMLAVAGHPARADEPQVITAAVPIAFPPYYMLDEQGRPAGFAIDVMDAVAVRAGYKMRYIPEASWPAILEDFRKGDAFLIPNAGMTAERAVYADFTPPVETFSVSIFSRQGTSIIFGIDQLRGRKVAVVVSNVGVALLKNRSDLTTIVYDDPERALFALLAGEVDALVYPEPVMWHLARQANVDHMIKVVGAPLAEVKRAIAVRKGMPDLHRRLSAAVSEFVNTPEYQAIYVNWFGPQESYWTNERTLHIVFVEGAALLVFVMLTLYLWRLNRQLKAARREAVGASNAKTHFLAAASHDVRQPVQALHLLLATLRSKQQEPDTTKVVGQMHETLEELSGLLDRLLVISKLDAGLITPNRQAVGLGPILDGLVQDVSPAAELAGTTVRCRPCRFHAFTDPVLLETMLRNILENALKYAPGGKVMLGCRRRKDRVLIEVWDNGCGIPDDRVKDIFEEFVQVGNEGRNRMHGLGIGLAVVRRLAMLLDHEVLVRSWVGRGSVFTIDLPGVDDENQ